MTVTWNQDITVVVTVGKNQVENFKKNLNKHILALDYTTAVNKNAPALVDFTVSLVYCNSHLLIEASKDI